MFVFAVTMIYVIITSNTCDSKLQLPLIQKTTQTMRHRSEVDGLSDIVMRYCLSLFVPVTAQSKY